MRPRPEGRGEPRPAKACTRPATTASMRPRPEGRGEPPRQRPMQPAQGASMRPRPEGRGEPRQSNYRCYPPTKLQCGHDPKAVENSQRCLTSCCTFQSFNAATTRRPWRTSSWRNNADEHTKASMRPRPEGRGELTEASASHDRHSGFNAATTRRPWRTQQAVVSGRRLATASMRPRPEGRGEHTLRRML